GILVASRGRLYVPVDRGVAIVDPLGGNLLRVIRLPVSPAAIWVGRFSGRLLAALYAGDRIAVVDTTSAGARPTFPTVVRKPVAIWGSGGVAYVVSVAERKVVRLDALTGDRLGAATVPLGA